jgi:hypothetical protein
MNSGDQLAGIGRSFARVRDPDFVKNNNILGFSATSFALPDYFLVLMVSAIEPAATGPSTMKFS